MNTVGTPLLWGGFAVVVAIMLAIDLLFIEQSPDAVP